MTGRVTSLLFLSLFICDVIGQRYGGSNNARGGRKNNNGGAQEQRLREVYNWSQFDFNFPNANARQQAIQSGTFVSTNASAPASIEASGNRVFITLPRWKNGVPATLSTVPFPSDNPSPLLTPYPSWEMNRQGNCAGLTSVYRVKADECSRLWVLDTGTVNAFESADNICPFKVVAFDLRNDQIVHTFEFPAVSLY